MNKTLSAKQLTASKQSSIAINLLKGGLLQMALVPTFLQKKKVAQ